MELYCELSKPEWATFLSPQYAPALLYYAYVPIIIILLFFSIFVLLKDKFSIISRILFSISLFFILWILNIFLQWMATYEIVVNMSWIITALIEVPIYIFTVLFVYKFINVENIPLRSKILLFLPFLSIILLTPTKYNIVSFDLVNCESNLGILWNYIYYLIEPLYIILIPIITTIRVKSLANNKSQRKQIIITGLAATIFVIIFWASNLWGEITQSYEVNLWGPIGMVVFVATLTFLIVRFKAFDVKLIGAQALVWALIILIGSEFFFVESVTNQILVGVTLVISTFVGMIIVRSIKKEIAQREQIEKNNVELKKLNDDKSEFISFATHQIRTPLTSIKGYSANILDGDYGELNPELKDAVQKILVRGIDAVTLISQYLDKSKMELGQLKYDFMDFDIVELTKSVTKGFEPNAEQAKLSLKFNANGLASCIVNADKGKTKEVIGNLIDNAIKYTPSGSIEVSVFKKDNKVLVKFSDTGAGMSKAVITNLYRKFGRAKDAAKTNILGNGLGLFLTKTFMEAMNGRSWAESEGDGKGSQFYIELPTKAEEIKTTISV